MKARVEIDEMGRFILILPEDVVEEFELDEGDQAMVDISEGLVILEFLA